MIRNSCAELSQANDRVVCRLQVGEFLAQKILQSSNIRQGQIVRRRERLCSCKSQTEEEAEQRCGTVTITITVYNISVFNHLRGKT